MRTTFSRRGAVAWIGGAAALGVLAAGCAGPAGGATAGHGATMNDPDATPASELPGATEAPLVLLDTRPPGMDGVQGTAWRALGEQDPGTTLTVRMTGLPPGSHYVGHLHASACAQDNGGPHFKFDQSGPAEPPNEVHLAFVAAADGTGSATATNGSAAGGARSVVIHPAEATDERLACADF